MIRFLTLKKVVTFLLIAVVIVLAFSALSLGSQMSEAQNKVSDLQNQVAYYENIMHAPANVTFTNISIGNWYHQEKYGPPPYYKAINLTLQNLGARSIGGLTLAFKVKGPININEFGIYVSTWQLGILHVQEQKSLVVTLVPYNADGKYALSQSNFTITLMLDDLVLDEQTVEI